MNELTVTPNYSGVALPALISASGKRAAWRFLEFFTVKHPQQKHATRRTPGRRGRSCVGARGRGFGVQPEGQKVTPSNNNGRIQHNPVVGGSRLIAHEIR
jgi:hypothetical protein